MAEVTFWLMTAAFRNWFILSKHLPLSLKFRGTGDSIFKGYTLLLNYTENSKHMELFIHPSIIHVNEYGNFIFIWLRESQWPHDVMETDSVVEASLGRSESIGPYCFSPSNFWVFYLRRYSRAVCLNSWVAQPWSINGVLPLHFNRNQAQKQIGSALCSVFRKFEVYLFTLTTSVRLQRWD